jgi:gluconate 2-dehydrogenase gamma chain
MEYKKNLSRNVLLEAGVQLSLIAALAELPKRSESAAEDGVFIRPPLAGNYFTNHERRVLDAVQMQLFPEDGYGPSAQDLNALSYLEGAMTDRVNFNDGDPEFIRKGARRLDDMSRTAHGIGFTELTHELQNEVLEQTAQSKFGKNWLSLLIFYLTEALILDPYYGGNPDMIGWMWLEHRPGFPRPVEGKTYRDFE